MTLRVEGQLRSRSRRAALSRILLAGAAAASVVLALLAFEMRGPVAVALMSTALSLAYAAFRRGWEHAPRVAALVVDGDDVEIGGVHVERKAIASAHRERGRVTMALANGDEHVLHTSPAEAEGLIEALGFGPGRRVVRLVVGGYPDPRTQSIAAIATGVSVLVAMPLIAALLASAALAMFGGREDERIAATVLVVPALLATVLAIGLSRAVRRAVIDIGGEGVRVAIGTQRPRWLPFQRLDASLDGRVLRLGSVVETLRVRCASEAEATTLLRAIENARAGRVHADVDVTPLARGSDDVETWRARLRSMLSGSGYRNVLGPDELARVVEDATASPEARVGAAVALSSLGDRAPELARVRVAIEGVASPHLRVALDRAAAGEIDEDALAASIPSAEKL